MESQYIPQNGIIHTSQNRSHMQLRENSWDISEIQTTNNVIYTLAEALIFNFMIYKIFFISLPSGTLVPPNLCLLLGLSHILNFSNISFSSELNRLRALRFKSLYKKLLIYNYNQFHEPDLRFYLVKLCKRYKQCTIASLLKVLPLNVGVYLTLEIHNTLFTDPT